jgi:molybdate transport system ATP-binding protein
VADTVTVVAADTAPLLEAHLVVARGQWSLDVEMTLEERGVTALLGPNGAGKSTALQALAGLHRLDGGFIRLADRVLDDPSGGHFVPTEDRAAGLVFQDYLLFPRMSARDNVAFGLRARGIDKGQARQRADSWLARFGLAADADRRPAELSGGQAQRVALARALATDPRLLLLDEPLAALDAGTRMSVRTDLRRHLDDFDGATILVTHDPLDALVLADNVVVIENGRVVQAGTPADVARHPRTRYVAQLVGLNLLRGTARAGAVRLDDGTTLAVADTYEGRVFVVARPSAIAVYAGEPHGSPRNSWPAVLTSLEQQGHAVRVAAKGPPDVVVDVTAEAVAELRLTVGAEVWLSVKATDLVVYPA